MSSVLRQKENKSAPELCLLKKVICRSDRVDEASRGLLMAT